MGQQVGKVHVQLPPTSRHAHAYSFPPDLPKFPSRGSRLKTWTLTII